MWDAKTDVLVVGAGGCGLTAALSARERGVRVTLLEKESEVGGATTMSGGSILGADTRAQREAGIDDSPEALTEDIIEHSSQEANIDVVAALAMESRQTIDWLESKLGLSLTVNMGPYGRHGHRVHRRHWLAAEEGIHRSGEQLIAELLGAAREREVEILTNYPVEELVVKNGRVAGVKAGKSKIERIRAQKVVLATGGFGNNPKMRAEHIPLSDEMLYWGDEGSTGDGILLGTTAGADANHLSSFLGFPTISHPESVFVPWETTKEGAFVVTESGRRFADAGNCAYSEFTAEMLNSDGNSMYLILDKPVYDAMASQPSTADRWEICAENDVFISADSPESLAERLGVNASNFQKTIEALEAVATPAKVASDGHPRQVTRPLSAPFFGTEIKPAILQTQGGLRIDERGRVLDTNGNPLPNLYAGGGAAVSVSGSQATGYLSGNGLLTALNLGRIAGRDAANCIKQKTIDS